jgi:hypothetical protein
VKELGIATPITVGDEEFDNLFVITKGPQPRMVRLRFH